MEPEIRLALVYELEDMGFTPHQAITIAKMREACEEQGPDPTFIYRRPYKEVKEGEHGTVG